jgi:hypothetical protein
MHTAQGTLSAQVIHEILKSLRNGLRNSIYVEGSFVAGSSLYTEEVGEIVESLILHLSKAAPQSHRAVDIATTLSGFSRTIVSDAPEAKKMFAVLVHKLLDREEYDRLNSPQELCGACTIEMAMQGLQCKNMEDPGTVELVEWIGRHMERIESLTADEWRMIIGVSARSAFNDT